MNFVWGTALQFALALRAQTNTIFRARWPRALAASGISFLRRLIRIARISFRLKGPSIIFWALVFAGIVIVLVRADQHLGIKKVEPFLLGTSIITTFVFSYFSIFHPASRETLRFPRFTYTAFLSINCVNAAICLMLAHIFLNASFDTYDSDRFLRGALNTWRIPGLASIYHYHALWVVGILTAVDLLIANFHRSPRIQRRFWWLFVVIGLPCLASFAAVLLVRDAWYPIWHEVIDQQRFEAGAITFQLLVANIQIITAQIFERLRHGLGMPRRWLGTRPRNAHGQFVRIR